MNNEIYTSLSVRRRTDVKGKPWQGFLTYKDSGTGKFRKLSKTFPLTEVKTKAQALAATEEWRCSAEQVHLAPQMSKMLVPDYIEDFINHKGHLADTTADTYKYMLKHIHRSELNKPLRELTTEDVQNWLFALQDEGVGPTVRDKALRLLKSACKNARKLKQIPENPCDLIDRDNGKPKLPKPDPNPLDSKELARLNSLLELMGHSQMADAVRLALLTGMREGEICGLRWKDVDGWESGKYGAITIRNVISRSSKGQKNKAMPKNECARKIHVSEQIQQLFEFRRQEMRLTCLNAGIPFSGEQYVMGTISAVVGEGFFSPNYLSKLWHMFAEANNIRGVKGRFATFHDLRHTFATHALASGIDVVTVAAILGHKNRAVTLNVYAEFLPDVTAAAQDFMGQLMSARESPAQVIRYAANG